MYNYLQYVTIVLLFCCFGSRGILAQNSDQTLIQCQNASSLTNLTASFYGSWFEASRSPASKQSCVGLDLFSNTTGLYLNLTTPENVNGNALNINQTLTYKLSFQAPSVTGQTSPDGGYNFTLSPNSNVTIKILSTDNTNYALICGYNTNTTLGNSFSAILTRQRGVANATLTSYAVQVNSTYAGFSNMSDVNQSSVCYRNSAASHASALSFILAIVYVLFKFVN